MKQVNITTKAAVTTTALVGICLMSFGTMGFSSSAQQASTSIESWDTSESEINSASSLLEQASEAAISGHPEEAIHLFKQSYYLGSDPSQSNLCLEVWTKFVLDQANLMNKKDQPVQCNVLLQSHLTNLNEIQTLDDVNWSLTASMKDVLFKQIRVVKRKCQLIGNQFLYEATELYEKSKGYFVWSEWLCYYPGTWNDNEKLQMDSLHSTNLSAQYYEQFDESSRTKLAQQYQILRNELSTSEYKQQIAKDRLIIKPISSRAVAMMGGA